MNPRDLKIYTLRHFLFYMGVACIASTLVWATSEALAWSYNLSVAVLFVAGVVVCLLALRESLFAPAQKPRRRAHGRHT
jgi:hypothetical protein